MEIRKYGDRTAVTITCEPPGRTKQSSVDECDINFIMNKWKRTGELPSTNTRPPTYGDFSNVADYMQAQNSILEADRAFESLPSWVREQFQNSPHELISFIADPNNQDECIKLGLVPTPEGYEPPEAPDPTADPPAPAPEPPPQGD